MDACRKEELEQRPHPPQVRGAAQGAVESMRQRVPAHLACRPDLSICEVARVRAQPQASYDLGSHEEPTARYRSSPQPELAVLVGVSAAGQWPDVPRSL